MGIQGEIYLLLYQLGYCYHRKMFVDHESVIYVFVRSSILQEQILMLYWRTKVTILFYLVDISLIIGLFFYLSV